LGALGSTGRGAASAAAARTAARVGEGCTLRQAIDYANNNDPLVPTRIEFASGVERVSLDNEADPLGPIAASVCIDGRTDETGGKVTVSRPLFALFYPDRSVFRFYNNPAPISGDDPEPIDVCFRDLFIDGGSSAITDQGNDGEGDTDPSSFVSMDIVDCHFENQGGTIIAWRSVSVSLLRIVDSTLQHSVDTRENSDCVSTEAQNNLNANKIEIVNSHMEKCRANCVAILGASRLLY
jgi:hypothetical protein